MGFVMRDLTKRWPGAQIPFVIDPALSGDQRQIVNDAISYWSNTAGLLLTPRGTEADFLLFVADQPGMFGGFSGIGRTGGQPTIRMDFGWTEAVGALLHEIGHTAGLIHEHQRPDRDQYVLAMGPDRWPPADPWHDFESGRDCDRSEPPRATPRLVPTSWPVHHSNSLTRRPDKPITSTRGSAHGSLAA